MQKAAVDIEKIAAQHRIVGRRDDLLAICACLHAQRHVLLEGPVGVGKTALARCVSEGFGRGFVRIDGDARYTEAKLVGHFDPPGVLERGYQPDLFIPGPLVEAMKNGAILFINELNRMPEGVQNVLLPAMDEGRIAVPRLGVIQAAPGFSIIATQNPSEFVATGHLSEALLDRFELVALTYQDAPEECQIVTQQVKANPSPDLIEQAVALARATRTDPRIRRGASLRAAVAIADLAAVLDGDLTRAAELALPTRIEMAPEQEELTIDRLVSDLQKKNP